MHFDPVQTAATIAAILVASTRLLNAAKPLWDRLPEPLYSLVPALVLVLPDLVQRLAGVQTGTDLAVELVTAIALIVPGAKSAAHKDALAKRAQLTAKAKSAGVTLMVLALCAPVALLGCNTHVNWPAVLKCTDDLRSDLASAVAAVLRTPGDPAPALEALAKQLGADGPEAVACALQAFVQKASAQPDAADVDALRKALKFADERGIRVR